MAIPMFETTTVKLEKSASALEDALAQFGKTASAFGHTDDIFSPLNSATAEGNGFDEWLANDLQFSTLSGDEASTTSSSPFTSSAEDSPLFGFESLIGNSFDTSLFDLSDLLGSAAPAALPVQTVVAAPAPPVLTTAAVQQAAAALNIPWSHDLEQAVMLQAQSAQQIALPSIPSVTIPVAPKVEVQERSLTDFAPATPLSAAPTAAAPKTTKGTKRSASMTPEAEIDEIVAKRAKNTDAARRSRLKKLIKLETLESKVSELESSNTRLNMKVAVLETEKNGHLAKEAEQSARIAQLESKLAQAHLALTQRA